MKIKHVLLGILLMGTILTSKAQLLLDEGFNYGSVSDTLTNPAIGGANWKRHSGTGGPLQYLTTSLSYTGYGSNGLAGSISFAHASGSREDANRAMSNSVSSGSVYVSFLLNVTNSGGTTGDYAFHFNDTNGTTLPNNVFKGRLFLKDGATSGTFKLGISKGGAAATAVFTSTDYPTNTTVVVVMKYVFNSATTTDDSVYATVISASIPTTEPSFAIAATDISSADLAKIKSFCVRQGTVGTGAGVVDGIRIATTWTDLMPGASVPVTPPSAILALSSSSLTKTTATVSWTKPSGYVDSTMTTLVFLKQGSTPTAGTPTWNASVYAGNTDFSLSTSTFQNDGAAKCMYNADSNSIAVSGLTLGTTYYAMVYVVRTADSSYSTAVGTNFQTLGIPAAITALGFAATAQTKATISWTKAAGYVDSTMSTLVFVKEASAVTAGTPTSASSVYTADTNFTGSGTAYQNDPAAKCVYNGDGNTVSISNLILNTNYHVLVYTVRTADTTYSTSAIANGTTFGLLAPPTALNSVGLGSIGGTISTVQWKKGNYADSSMTIVVYMKQGTSITQGTLNTAVNDVTANMQFGQGSRLSTDTLAYCIYKGDNISVDVTGLTAATNYALIAYVVRDADTSYSSAVTTTYTTLAPPAAPTALAISNKTQTTFSVSFTRPANVDTLTHSFLLFVKQGSAVTQGTPTTAVTQYLANTVFRGGSIYQNDTSAFCISNGAANTITVSGLTAGTTYHVLAYAVRKADSVYSIAATVSGLTLLPNPNPATGVSVTGTGQTTATINWSKPGDYVNATFTTLVFAKKGSPINAAPSGALSKYTANAVLGSGTKLASDTNAFCVFKGDTTFVNLSNLTSNSSYYVSTFMVRDADSAYSTEAPGTGSTLGVPPYYPIGSINKVNSTTGVPDSLNVRATVRGVVYGTNQRATGLQFVLRDATGGTTIFITTKNFGYTVTEGDSIEAQGVVTSFRGLHEMGTLDTVIVLGTGKTLKQPTVVPKVDEAAENDLVKVNGVKFITPPAGGVWPSASTNINVTTATNDTVVIRILSTFSIAGKPLPTTPTFNIVGLGAQFSTSATAPYPFNGYQLFPRNQADVTEIPVILPDSLNPFDLVSPADNDTVVLTATNLADTVFLSWTPSLNSNGVDTTGYTFILDTTGGDFSLPRFEMATGKVNALALTKNSIYSLAVANGIGSGQLFGGIWEVKAESNNLVRYSTSHRNIFIKNDVTTGINEVTRLNAINLYPNPADQLATIQGLNPHHDVVTIVTIEGKMKHTFTASSPTETLTLSGLDAGVYFVKIQSGNAVVVKKLIVQ